MGELEFDRVYQEQRGFVYLGSLKLRQTDVLFRNEKTGRVDHYQSSEVDSAEWVIRARGACLKLILSNGNVHRYDGLGESDFERIKTFLQNNYDCELTRKDLSYKGWNWGKLKIAGNTLDFQVSSNSAFEIPLNNVSQVKNTKNEVTLEFHPNDDAEINLMEMRFHLPVDKDTDKEETLADEICKRVMAKADILQVTGDGIAEFKEMQCLQPRGRYDLKLYSTFIHFHGKTFDYKIPLSTVFRMFLLPNRDNRNILFVLNIDPPIKHGQTRYHFVILQFDKASETVIELGLPEEELESKYEGKLMKEMSGPEYEVIARIFKVLVGRKITVPGSFTSQSGFHTISCSYKASVGMLYPLERGFIFVPRPPVHVRFDEISNVQFSRGTGAQRSFDFELETRSGVNYTFTSIEKDEYTRLFDYVVSKKLRVLNIDEASGGQNRGLYEEWSSDEGDHDAYLEKVKREGKKSGVMTIADMGEDDDEDDEDFLPPESGSDVAEEYDSNPETTDSSEGSSRPSESESASDDEEDEELIEDDEEREKRRLKKEKKKLKKEKERQRKERQKEKEREKRKKAASKREKESTSGGASKKRKKKDSNAPKRPLSAFFIFANEERENVKKEFPESGVAEQGKILGERWKAVDAETKERIQKLALEAKERYQVELAEYHRKIESGEIVVEEDDRKKKAPKAKKPRVTPDKSAKEPLRGGSFKSAEFIDANDDISSDSSLSSEDDAKKKKPASSSEAESSEDSD